MTHMNFVVIIMTDYQKKNNSKNLYSSQFPKKVLELSTVWALSVWCRVTIPERYWKKRFWFAFFIEVLRPLSSNKEKIDLKLNPFIWKNGSWREKFDEICKTKSQNVFKVFSATWNVVIKQRLTFILARPAVECSSLRAHVKVSTFHKNNDFVSQSTWKSVNCHFRYFLKLKRHFGHFFLNSIFLPFTLPTSTEGITVRLSHTYLPSLEFVMNSRLTTFDFSQGHERSTFSAINEFLLSKET